MMSYIINVDITISITRISKEKEMETNYIKKVMITFMTNYCRISGTLM